MDRCNNPSYGSDTNQWQPRYSLACETPEAQSLRFLAASFPESSWSGPSATLHHDPTHYQAPFNNNADFYLMAGQQQMSTSIPYSMAAATSAESSMMNSRPETPASVTSYGGNSFDIQSRAITSSSDVGTHAIDEIHYSLPFRRNCRSRAFTLIKISSYSSSRHCPSPPQASWGRSSLSKCMCLTPAVTGSVM